VTKNRFLSDVRVPEMLLVFRLADMIGGRRMGWEGGKRMLDCYGRCDGFWRKSDVVWRGVKRRRMEWKERKKEGGRR
jgi:hypothetical protein